MNNFLKHCEFRNFRDVHIFAYFAFLKYARKYVELENIYHYAILRQYYL